MAKWRLRDLFRGSSSEPEGPAPSRPPAAEAPSNAPPAQLMSDDPTGEDAGLDVEIVVTQVPPVERVTHTLSLLRDEGVVGSIAVGDEGDVLGADLPRLFEGEPTASLVLRLTELREALATGGSPLGTATFRYEGHSLYVSQLGSCVLGVLADQRAREPALDMAARLVGQRLDADATPS